MTNPEEVISKDKDESVPALARRVIISMDKQEAGGRNIVTKEDKEEAEQIAEDEAEKL